MQVTCQFLARFFMDLHHAFFFFNEVLIEARILNGYHRLPANDIEQLQAI